MSDDDATHMAAAMSYYGLVSLFPLTLGLISITSFFLEDALTRQSIVDWVASFLPGSESLIKANIDVVMEARGTIGAFAIVGLFWTGSAVFGGITRSINRAWDVHQDRPLYLSKARQLVMALMTGLMFLFSTSISTFLRIYERIAYLEFPHAETLVRGSSVLILYASSFALILAVFLMLYKFVPNTKTYWRYIWLGAIVAAVLFETTKNLFIWYLNTFTNFGNVYGTLASVVVLLLWAYLSGLILILGAELSSEYGRIRRGTERGMLLH
jgi:membrane protein